MIRASIADPPGYSIHFPALTWQRLDTSSSSRQLQSTDPNQLNAPFVSFRLFACLLVCVFVCCFAVLLRLAGYHAAVSETRFAGVVPGHHGKSRGL
jgi:hypothetical protein